MFSFSQKILPCQQSELLTRSSLISYFTKKGIVSLTRSNFFGQKKLVLKLLISPMRAVWIFEKFILSTILEYLVFWIDQSEDNALIWLLTLNLWLLVSL